MAGSLRYFAYQDDASNSWNVNLDESTYETLSLGFAQGPSTLATTQGRILAPSRKRPLEMRYAILKGLDVDSRVVSRKIYVGNTSATIWLNPTTAPLPTLVDFTPAANGAALTAVRVTALIGEKRYLLPGGDTGILDGDDETY